MKEVSASPILLTAEALARLDLQRQPFSERDDLGFIFSDASHTTQLNVALNILQASDRLLVVRGEPGVGKTAFLHGLQHRQSSSLRLLVMRGADLSDYDTACRRLLSGLGVRVTTPEISDDWVINRLHEMSRSGQRPAFLIDDGEDTPEDVLVGLIRLHEKHTEHGSAFGLAIAVSREFDDRLGELREGVISPEHVHTINLFPFNEEQTIDYLSQRLRLVGDSNDELLTVSDKQLIHQRAKGNPRQVHVEASKLLAQRGGMSVAQVEGDGSAGKTASGSRKTTGLVAAAAMVVLIAVLVGTYTLLGGDDGAASGEQVIALAPKEESQPFGVKVPEKYGFDKDDAPPADDIETTENGSVATNETTTDIANNDGSVNNSTNIADDSASAPSPQPSSTPEPAAEPSSEPDTATTAEDTSQTNTDDQATAETNTEAPTASTDQVEKPDAPAQEQANDVETVDAEAEPATTEPTTSEPPPQHGNAWVSSRNPAHFTLQLVGAYNRDTLQRYIQNHGLDGRARIATTNRDGKAWHVVLFGEYADKEAANAGLQNLPQGLRDNRPWLRQFSAVQSILLSAQD